MKIKLELNCPDDRTFLNFWDPLCGRDVVCHVIEGQLHMIQHDPEVGVVPDKLITFADFVRMVKENAEQSRIDTDKIKPNK